MKTATWNAAAPTLEAVQHTDSNTQELVDWLRANGSHVDVWGDQLWFTDDAGTQRCPLVGDWICLDPKRHTFRLVDEHVLPSLYTRG